MVVRVDGAFEGEMKSMDLDVTMRDVSGDRRGALVREGFASRLTADDLGFRDGERPLAIPALSPIRPAALGVGVAGGGAALGFVRRFCGVDGAGTDPASPSPRTGTSASTFLLRDCARGAAGGGIGVEVAAIAPSRADLRAAITAKRIDGRRECGGLHFDWWREERW